MPNMFSLNDVFFKRNRLGTTRSVNVCGAFTTSCTPVLQSSRRFLLQTLSDGTDHFNELCCTCFGFNSLPLLYFSFLVTLLSPNVCFNFVVFSLSMDYTQKTSLWL